MLYTHLGRTGLTVSRLCLGTMNFGWGTGTQDAHAIMDKALELGVNFFDTANVYGWANHRGRTEEIIGEWLARGGGRRERIVLATKVHNAMRGDEPNSTGVSAYAVRRECEESLRRLRTDHIDLYQMHHIDRATPWEELWQAMELLVAQGKVLYVGSSNFAGWHIAAACEAANVRHGLGLVSEQCIYHLDNRWVELEVLPACRRYGLGVIPWSPLGGGLLAGALEKAPQGSRRDSEAFAKKVQAKRPQIEQYEALCRSLGHQPADVALAWALSNPVVTAPIIGPRTIDQLTGSLRSLEVKLDAGALKKLDEIWPAPGLNPGKPTPEAFAW